MVVMKRIQLYDTTLRDGMQGLGVKFTLEDKIAIAKRLDAMGIDYIEGGFPLASENEAIFFKRMKKIPLKNAKMVAFGSTRRPGGKAAEDKGIQALLGAETPSIIIVVKASVSHVEKILGTHPEENLAMLEDSIHCLGKEGREVLVDLEHFFDGYKEDASYAQSVLETASGAGASTLVLCDTNGGTLPFEAETIIKECKTPSLASLGVHFHNDTGTAVAASLAAVQAGAVQIQGTINGWGERCGNADLCVLAPNLIFKMKQNTGLNENMSELKDFSRFVAEKANIIPDKRQPFVGDSAFGHKAGQHADVLAKDASLMEHMDASLVGNKRKVLLSELAGKSTIVEKMSRYGDFNKQSPEVNQLVNLLKQREMQGYEYEAAEASFDMLIRKTLGQYTRLFELNNYHLESYKTGDMDSKTVGRIFLKSLGKEHMGAAVSHGPVGTLDGALRDALTPFYPFLKELSLVDYRVRVLNPENGAASGVRVFITTADKHQSWDTVGVSENVIEASWEALVDSLEYYYNNFVMEAR